MAAPKSGGKGGGGGGGAKKAKLAHEKRTNDDGAERGQFRLFAVHEMISDAAGPGVIVELDDKGTKAVIDPIFVRKAADGTLHGRTVACPATYDAVAARNAIQRYQAIAAKA